MAKRGTPEYKALISRLCREALIEAKKKILDHYGWTCNCCGEANPLFLTVDHVHNDGFRDRHPGGAKLSGLALYRKIIKEGFPKRYQILCMNCNHGKRMNNGICPHNSILENE